MTYADDIFCDILRKIDNPGQLQQITYELEAICAATGLRWNAKKCEMMALNCSERLLQPEDATKEEVLVDDEVGGTLYDAEGLEFLPEEDQRAVQDINRREQQAEGKQQILRMPSGQLELVNINKNGWGRTADDGILRVARVRGREHMNEDVSKFRCPICQAVFWDRRSLEGHSRWFQGGCGEEMSIRELRQLRVARTVERKKRAADAVRKENLSISPDSGTLIKSISKFKYLGTTVCDNLSLMQEISTRCGMAGAVLSKLAPIWNASAPLVKNSR